MESKLGLFEGDILLSEEKTGIPLKTVENVDDEMARKRMEGLLEESWVLGIMVWGSKATGFGAPNADWDALIYVTEEYYNSLEIMDTIWLEFDETVEPKRLVIDFSPISDAWFRQQMDSPLDIDHFPYEEGVVIHDPTGKLEEWRRKLARYPEEEHLDRLKNKYMLLMGSLGNAHVDEKRGFIVDSKLNLYRAIVAAANLWFAIKKSWAPPFKWWSKHAKKMGMTDDTYALFTNTFENPTLEFLVELYKHLRQMIVDDGYEFPNDSIRAFLETIHTDGRLQQIRHSYM